MIARQGEDMDINRMTQKSQEALQSAQGLALRHGHQEVDSDHLLLALLEQPRRPSVSGPGAEAGKIYLTQRLQQVFLRAEDEARPLRDEYVSIEHLLLALIEEGPGSPAGRALARHGVTRDSFL